MKISEIAFFLRDNLFILNIYNKSPRFIHNLIYSFYGCLKLLEGKKIENEELEQYENEERLSYEDIIQGQLKRLRRLLIHANNHSEYYNKLFKKLNFLPETIKNIEDLKILPILDKNILLDNFEDIKVDNYLGFKPKLMSTGGTTGASLKFLMDKRTHMKKEAQTLHYWKRHGFKVGRYNTIMFRAGVLNPGRRKNVKPWRFDYPRKMLYFSSYYASNSLYKEYYELLKKWKPKYMHFLPSAVYLFAKYLNDNKLIIKLNIAFSASEMLYPFQKKEIEKAFSCKVVDHYGHTEPGNYVVGQCENGCYHICTNDVIVEVTEDGTLLETSLVNYSMPFIRYKVGDKVDGLNYNCACGLKTPFFKKIYGRDSSIIYTGDERVISSIGFDQIFRGNNTRLGQIIQKTKGCLVLKLVTEKAFKKENEVDILNKLTDRVGVDTNITIKYVNDIPKAKSGKFNLVISEIKVDKI
jgi:phenylacetate-CoA ligase